jgi:hypothetical protein
MKVQSEGAQVKKKAPGGPGLPGAAWAYWQFTAFQARATVVYSTEFRP